MYDEESDHGYPAIDKLSYAELLKLEERIKTAIVARKAEQSIVAATPEHPLAGAFDRGVAAIMADGVGADLFDPYVGRRLAPLVAATGLADLGVEAIALVRSGGSGPAELFARSVITRRDEIIARAALSADEFDALLAALADPYFCFVDALSFAAWGRRP